MATKQKSKGGKTPPQQNSNLIEKKFINKKLGIEFESFIDEECNVFFKVKEVAQILGYKNTEDAIKRHVSENNKIKKVQHRETRGCTFTFYINETGFYELIFKSRLPDAKLFREWVFSKVLPSIRKFGYFNMFKSKKRLIIDGVKYNKHNVFTKYAASKDGNIINVKSKRIIKMINCNGYLYFNLCDKKLSKPKIYYQHRFVYEVFKGAIPRFFEIDHINNLKFDNRIKNLQLLTKKQNIEKSKNKPIISVNIETGEERRFDSITKASNDLDIHFSSISSICRKKFKTTKSKKDSCNYTFNFID